MIEFARQATARCRELVFLDRLQWLAAGGRMSKTSAFFGDVFHVKPVVTPLAEGVKKVAVVRRAEEQPELLLKTMQAELDPETEFDLMLEFSDNRPRIEGEIMPRLAQAFPNARVTLQPLSLTSGAHMGPGAWGAAWLARA